MTTSGSLPQIDLPTAGSRSARRPVSMLGIARELWHARDLITQFIRRDIAIKYTQAIMGFAWAILMPLLIVGAGLLFRLVLATLSGTPVDNQSVAGLALKATVWAFFSGALSMATVSIIAHANLIGKVYFPREALPIASVLAQATDFAIGLLVLAVLLPVLGVLPGPQAFGAVAALVLLIVFTLGAALLLSCANLFFRDVKYIVQVMLSFGVFATPVFFEPQMLGQRGAAVMMALPLSPIIQAFDVSIVRHHNLLKILQVPTRAGMITIWSPWMLAYAAVISFALLLVATRVFRSASSKFAEMA